MLFGKFQDGILCLFRNNRNQANAHIEDALHLLIRNITQLLQPRKHGRHIPAVR